MGAIATDKVLPEMHLPPYATLMQVYSHLLGIRETGTYEVRTHQGTRLVDMARPALQSLGRFGLRPRPMTFIHYIYIETKSN